MHGFLSVQHAASLLRSEAFRKLFPRFCCPSNMLSRSFPAKLSSSYLHAFLSVQHAASLLPSEALRKLFPRFPFRPPLVLAPPEANEKLNENPSIGDAFGKNEDPSCAEAGNRNPSTHSGNCLPTHQKLVCKEMKMSVHIGCKYYFAFLDKKMDQRKQHFCLHPRRKTTAAQMGGSKARNEPKDQPGRGWGTKQIGDSSRSWPERF